MEAPRAVKKRKLTDRTLPASILQEPEFSDSKLHQDLVAMEHKLDWTIMRKKAEIQEAIGKIPSTTRILRIFLSHTVANQAWQLNSQTAEDAPNFNDGSNIPAWSLRIEGRLLEPPGRTREKVTPKKFSSFVKRLVVDMDRDPTLYPAEANIVEWHPPPAVQGASSTHDGFTVRRTGDQATKLRITMYLAHYPEQYKVSPDLASILEIKEESRIGVINALWNYIRANNLQDKVDRRVIRLDDRLKALFGAEQLTFPQIPELVNHYLQPPDPIVLHYTIKPNESPPPTPQAWDVELKVEDTSIKNRMERVLLSMSSTTTQELARVDEQITVLVQQIHNSQLKRTFLDSFASDPPGFIQEWLESQSRDLESVLGSGPSEGLTIREEELKRSEFFRLPWVEEAVAVQEGLRLASKTAM